MMLLQVAKLLTARCGIVCINDYENGLYNAIVSDRRRPRTWIRGPV